MTQKLFLHQLRILQMQQPFPPGKNGVVMPCMPERRALCLQEELQPMLIATNLVKGGDGLHLTWSSWGVWHVAHNWRLELLISLNSQTLASWASRTCIL